MKIEIYKEQGKYVVIHDGWVHVFNTMEDVTKYIDRNVE